MSAERPVQEVPCPAPFAAPNLPAGALSALVQGLGALVGVEGVHHGNTARQFFGGRAAGRPTDPVHPHHFDTRLPGVGPAFQPRFESPFAAAGTVPRAREEPRLSRTGAGSMMTVTKVCPAIRRTCSSTPIARTPSQRIRSCSSSYFPAARRLYWQCASTRPGVWRCWPWRRGWRSTRPGPTALVQVVQPAQTRRINMGEGKAPTPRATPAPSPSSTPTTP